MAVDEETLIGVVARLIVDGLIFSSVAKRTFGRRQLSWPLDDNYPGRFEAGVF
jgi:hypothetical protein